MGDNFNVRALPSDFVSKSQPSKIIESLYEKKKAAHDAAVEEMRVRKDELDAEIEEEILSKSNALNVHLKEIKAETEDFLLVAKNTEENDLNLQARFQNITSKIFDSNEIRKKSIDEFESFLIHLEKQRSEKLKLILKETYEKLVQIKHEVPFELEEFFENEMLNINQVTLNNFQKFSELRAELKLQVENDSRLWTQDLCEIKEKFILLLRSAHRRMVSKSKLKAKEALAKSKSELMSKDFGALHEELESQLSQVPIVFEDVQKWINDIRITLASLDQTAKNIVNLYKSTIVILFNRFFDELEEVKTGLKLNAFVDKNDIAVFQSEIYTPAAEELELEFQKDFENLKNIWNNVIVSMQATIEDTYAFLKKSASLWDGHFERIDELQKLIITNVKVMVEKNNLSNEKYEVKLNILVDKLRQTPTVQKLDKNFAEVKKALDGIEKVYTSYATSEMNVIKKYRGMVDSATDVLMAEIKRFLKMNPPDEDRDPKKQRKRASQTSELAVDINEQLIPQQMLFCQFQVDAVKNWMFGLWEALNQYLTVGKEEILAIADDWINMECERVKKRLHVKLAFHRPRHERIRYTVYEKRLKELEKHNNRFISHKMAIEKEVKDIKEKQKLSEQKYDEICKKYSDEVEKIENKITNTRYSYQVKRYRQTLVNITKEAKQSLDNILDGNNNRGQNIMDDLKISNLKFLKVVKLFSEHGNYSVEEVKTLIKNLIKLEKATAKSLQTISKDDSLKHGKFSGTLENENDDISSMIQELAEEHEHNETTVKKIHKLQGDIHSEVVSIKTCLKALQTLLKSLAEVSAQNLGDQTYLEEFSNQLQEVITQLTAQNNFFTHPQPVVVYMPGTDEARSTSAASATKSDDYTILLFSVKPNIEEDSFMSKLNCLLYKSLGNIQTTAKEFYTQHNCLLLDSTIIQPSYEDFMDEVLDKYKIFLIQCEICWVENASEFLNILGDFIHFKGQYLLEFESKFCSLSHDHCKTVTANIMKQLHEKNDGMKKKYEAVHEKLKALHGHPNNKYLLENVEEEFKELVAENEEALNGLLEPYIDILIDEYETTRTVFEETKEILNELSQDYGLPSLKTALNEQLNTKLELMNKLIEGDKTSQLSVNADSNVPISVSKQIVAYIRNMELPTQAKGDSFISVSTASTTEKSASEDFISELEENCEKDTQQITEFVNDVMIAYNENFQQIWEKEVNSVLNLYKVKYDKNNL